MLKRSLGSVRNLEYQNPVPVLQSFYRFFTPFSKPHSVLFLVFIIVLQFRIDGALLSSRCLFFKARLENAQQMINCLQNVTARTPFSTPFSI